ncbi:hypothetical protein [Fimbriiglobus ruber]|uniref:Uncharacterized protein n=1 Tax=Fimbriiglobus ruber TaxID=1908690 RepID=A0A225D3N0_9BACT|nr:hypothetical protein [Fimbriiglobus ruber]OWK34234.1 hypothetical protein FRUB_10205 [Fimbriiglobus ruber]
MNAQTILIRCIDVGCGTNTATVRDARTGQTVKIRDARLVTGPNGWLCVEAEIMTAVAKSALVKLSDGQTIWI